MQGKWGKICLLDRQSTRPSRQCSLIIGFQKRLENLETKIEQGKVMECKTNNKKTWNVVISHAVQSPIRTSLDLCILL